MQNKDMYEVNFTSEQLSEVADYQKLVIEEFARRFTKYEKQMEVDIFLVSFMVIISNMLNTFGIDKVELFMGDLTRNLLQTHSRIKELAHFMKFENGVKISDSKFN
jgi:hypothetical protein